MLQGITTRMNHRNFSSVIQLSGSGTFCSDVKRVDLVVTSEEAGPAAVTRPLQPQMGNTPG